MAEIFLYLLTAHLIGDWIIQTSWMALEKSKHLFPLLAHVVTYHIFTFGALYLVGVDLVQALWATLFLAVTHAILDNRRFEFWWLRKIKKVKDEEIPVWLLLGVDQSFHLVLLALVAFWLH
ncbi:hypothetical protein A2V54_01715 [candidate division WWE3 bacterium RBG_19FT_COMBO_53_11]|uniref:DUF3307 domain-containing protein n=1 Tax=candidate division WWE3 bacterium RBG_19FT_COMBO_53_11 TaxID=1802613 RepID=A0A1F4UIG9_UNCKA|nr:MAG: hypothetical protein A2155_00370 [candidate division WWE3 bacterium RBG_16_52_45]OGC44768.1 MAG: hypothetical protein A2V54_01715 [candidate division WWE3 bacterium RBG_19FT_COMBO_53_11]